MNVIFPISKRSNSDVPVLRLASLSKLVLRGCHRTSSHPAQPEQLDGLTWSVNFIVASRTVYDIANTRGLDGDHLSLG